MKTLWLLLVLCVVAPRVEAAPSCMPSPTLVPLVGVMPPGAGAPGPYWAAWKCPDNTVYFRDWSWPEVLGIVYTFATGGQVTQAQMQASYAAANTGPAASAVERAYAHAVFVDQGWMPPLSLDGIAYKQRLSVNGLQYVPFGTVPASTPCLRVGKAGDFMPLPDRSIVRKNAPVDVYPLVLYGRCG